MKNLEQHRHNMNNMGDDNSDFSTRNKTSNGHVMCFIVISIIITNNIYNNYTRPKLVSGALTRFSLQTLVMSLGAMTHSLNISDIYVTVITQNPLTLVFATLFRQN